MIVFYRFYCRIAKNRRHGYVKTEDDTEELPILGAKNLKNESRIFKKKIDHYAVFYRHIFGI